MLWQIIIWGAAFLFFIAVEASTPCLVAFWFVIGALGGLITTLCGGAFWLQCLIFVVISVALLVCLRPFLKKYIKPRQTTTNVDSLPGQEALVTERIDNLRSQGAVKLNGLEWSARSTDGSVLEPGTRIVIERIEGVKAIVRPVPVPAGKN